MFVAWQKPNIVSIFREGIVMAEKKNRLGLAISILPVRIGGSISLVQ